MAAGQATNGAQTISPQRPKVAAGEVDAKKLLLLMDTDNTGKVSKQEFMNFERTNGIAIDSIESWKG